MLFRRAIPIEIHDNGQFMKDDAISVTISRNYHFVHCKNLIRCIDTKIIALLTWININKHVL